MCGCVDVSDHVSSFLLESLIKLNPTISQSQVCVLLELCCFTLVKEFLALWVNVDTDIRAWGQGSANIKGGLQQVFPSFMVIGK